MCGGCPRLVIANWVRADVAEASVLGLIRGRSATSYEPTATATRAEAVVVPMWLLQLPGDLQ